MWRRVFLLKSSVALWVVLIPAAVASDASSSGQNRIPSAYPFEVGAATHETRADARAVFQFPNASEIPAGVETVSSPPPTTRTSFMATWDNVAGATGYLLDVSTNESFSNYVDGYHDLDISGVTGRVVTGLNQGTTYYYRVRPYTAAGPGSYSETMTATTVPTTGLIIHPTFDSSITGSPNAAAIEAMINRAISIYESLFSDPITIQIRFRYATTGPNGIPLPQGALSQSFTALYMAPWDIYINELRADAKTNNDNLAIASLPGSALSANIVAASANARAVGGNAPPDMFANGTTGPGGPYDGIVTLNSAAPYQFTRPVSPSNYDAQRQTEHEIDEVMGLGSRLGTNLSDLRPQDVFSWSSPSVRNLTSSGTRYFSINSGNTNIVNFNQNPMYDFGDWLSTACPQTHSYVQNAFVCTGQYSDVTPTSPEGINLDVIGYDLASPLVTSSASNVTSSSATLNGTVNPGGLPTSVHFEYGTTTSYGSSTATQSYNGSTTQNVAASIMGLSPNTTYHFRLVGTNTHGTSYGSDRTFTTASPTGSPLVTTNPATNVASFSATLNGSVYPHGLTTTVYFQYGTTTTYRFTTASQTKMGNSYQSVSANISGLSASITYHFRIVATNSSGTTYGADRTFSTLSATGPPVVTTNPASNISISSATLNGTVDCHGLATGVYFQYGRTTSYGSTTANVTHGGNTYLNISANISGLSATTTYHFRIVASNSAGTRYGSDRTFSTVPPDQSVAWQNNTAHDGFDPASRLAPPLTLKWTHNLSANVFSISYPLIAQGLVFVTTATNQGDTLMALDEHTGTTVWSADVGGCCFANAAYDSGKIFIINGNGLMKAFNAATGTLLWSVSLPGQYSFTSPPTAANGIVFTGGAGSGGTVYAVNESNGAVLWTMGVENGDHSSPAVTQGRVFVSYSCPQVYAFNATTGQQLWNYPSGCPNGCEGGGGKTPVVHAAQVYVRDDFCDPTNAIVLDATTGATIRGFNSDRPPAFFGNLALYLQDGTLHGVNAPNGQVLWSFVGDGGLTSPPLVVNQTIYIGSSSGTLYGLNTSGQQIWSTQVGAAIPAPDEQNPFSATGLGAGDNLLIVPTPRVLAAYGN